MRATGITLLALLPRLAYLFYARPEFDGVYWAIATALLRSGSFAINETTTTDYEPLYPLFIAVTRAVVGDRALLVQLIQVMLASVGAVGLYRLAETLTGQPRVAAVGSLLYAFDPLLVRQAALHSEAALTTTLLIAFASSFVRATTTRRAAYAGAWLAAVLLTRTMALPLVVAGAALLILERRRGAALALTASALLPLAPFVARNHAVNGSWLPTRSGLSLFVGHSPHAAALLPDDDVDLLIPLAEEIVARERPDLSPDAPEYARAADVILTRHAVRHIAEDPLRAAVQLLRNVGYFFSPRPVPYRIIGEGTRLVIRDGRPTVENARDRSPVEVVVYGTSYSLVLVAAGAGVYLRRHQLRRDALLWCIVATFIVVHAAYFPATRYRAPMTFVLLFYAAVAVDRGAGRVCTAEPG
jgi:hypothetical protein